MLKVWTEEMKLFALHISHSTKLWFIHLFPYLFARIRAGQKHADPDPKPCYVLTLTPTHLPTYRPTYVAAIDPPTYLPPNHLFPYQPTYMAAAREENVVELFP